MRDVKGSEEVKKRSKGREGRNRRRHGVEFKLRCVKLRSEEGIPYSLLGKEHWGRFNTVFIAPSQIIVLGYFDYFIVYLFHIVWLVGFYILLF